MNVKVCKVNRLKNRPRFSDDIWGRWLGTQRTFEIFKSVINEVGKMYRITFTGECGKSVVFLNVTTINVVGDLETTMFVKDTDSARYLHRRSGHSEHTFTGIPFSQFRRAVVICSTEEYKLECIERMQKKFIGSGYREDDLEQSKIRALQLDRISVLNNNAGIGKNTTDNKMGVMAFVVYQHPALRKELNKFFREYDEDLQQILGDTRFVVSERKHRNTAEYLFGKSSFSQQKPVLRDTQQCQSKKCHGCVSMTLPRKLDINGIKIKLDYNFDCSSDSVICLARCKICIGTIDESKNFYFGQTVITVRTRMNGHREKFKVSKYDNSALSYHTYDKHIEKFPEKLLNFEFGIVKQVSPQNLDRVEDYYIYNTNADIKGLNRYKVAKL